MSETAEKQQPLTRADIGSIVQAIQSINRLTSKAIKEKNDDAELSGQRQFLARILCTHAGELIQAWMIIADEYQPLVSAFASLTSRAAAVTQARNVQIAAIEAAQAQVQPANVVESGIRKE